VLDHFSVQADDMAAASAFYDTVLAPLGYKRVMDFGVAIGYGDERPYFWLSQATDPPPGRESHIAFAAADRAGVLAFFEAAKTTGAEVLHEPRVWPEYHPAYFGAFVRDPMGNNVEAVCHSPE
jgi:catechol 2,3-dioxygenase-like lactoylglutathione lyase family enzyme